MISSPDRRTTALLIDEAGALRPTPANKLRDEECAEMRAVSDPPEFASLPPRPIMPRLADRGRHIASETSLCRVLRTHGQ